MSVDILAGRCDDCGAHLTIDEMEGRFCRNCERREHELDDEADPGEEYEEVDCGRTDDGTCMYAGSEWCDFECPYR